MKEKILKLILEYSVKDKLVDRNFVSELISIVIKSRDLQEYVKNIKFTNTLSKEADSITLAAYAYYTKTIMVDYESISHVLERSLDKYYDLFTNLEKTIYLNYMITQYILHELEHANQRKACNNSDDNSIETQLLRSCNYADTFLTSPEFFEMVISGKITESDIKSYSQYHKELYHQYYDVNPSERFAQINSYSIIVNSLTHIKDKVNNLYDFETASLYEQLLQAYQNGVEPCPTQTYLYGTQ